MDRIFSIAIVSVLTVFLISSCDSGTRTQEEGITGVENEQIPEVAEAEEFGTDDFVDMTIAEVVAERSTLNKLQAAADSAGLLSELAEQGPYTLLAPSNAAFENLSQDVYNSLMNDKEQLQEILKYHIIPADLSSIDITDGYIINTLAGNEVQFQVDQTGLSVNNAEVLEADLETENGTIHIINAVLLPANDQNQ
jgi:uncharacterized surface protein with fasciclin (FAS1) repeats